MAELTYQVEKGQNGLSVNIIFNYNYVIKLFHCKANKHHNTSNNQSEEDHNYHSTNNNQQEEGHPNYL